MSLPDNAILEADLGHGVALYDVSHLLPQHADKDYRSRRRSRITEQYLHHSGRLGKPGYAGLRNSARYVVRHRGWPGAPYHTWIPYEDLFDEKGRRVVFRAQPSTARTYHAGTGPNNRGVAHCVQGNTTQHPLSDQQIACLPEVLKYFAQDLNIKSTKLFGHFEANHRGDGHSKASCPGSHASAWLQGLRGGGRMLA
jgi:hypothetical protein